ncbi:MAG: aspartyl-phosphate phosphatase Spo0E family protein [Firmicutes bacterium]|nr:aspartyl-phosphate phosphatase Spo0E family protein [Bacillota bacterium]
MNQCNTDVIAAQEIERIKLQISELKFKMAQAFDETGETNQKVLGISIEIDELMNQYYRLAGKGM